MPLGDRSRAGRVVHPGRHLHAGAGGGVRRGAREDADEVRYEDRCVRVWEFVCLINVHVCKYIGEIDTALFIGPSSYEIALFTLLNAVEREFA